MPEPSIQDITNIAVDPERATGNPGVVYDSRELIRTLNQAGQQKAENDWRKYNMFMGNLKEVYKDLNEIAKQPVLTEDREKLKQTMADIVKGISSDPKGFFGGGAKYQETLGKLTQLQTETTESKQNNLYDAAHRQYFYANPELDTPENRAVVDNYRKGQLGTRNPYMLKLPGLFDPKAIADQLNIISKKDYSDDTVTPDNQFIKKTSGTKYDPVTYRNAAETFYLESDKRGNPLSKTLAERFNQLPQDLKDKYNQTGGDPVKGYYLDMMESYRLQDVSKTDLQSNPGYLEKEKIAAANYRERLQQNGANYRANLPYEKVKLAAKDAEEAAKNFGNIIYGINSSSVKGKGWGNYKMINGAIVNDKGAVDSGVSGEFKVPAEGVNNSILTEFNKYAGGRTVTGPDGEVKTTSVVSEIKPDEDGYITIRVENGIITGVKTKEQTFADTDQFQYITTQTSQKGVTKYKKPEDISGGAGATETPQQLRNKYNY